MRPVFLNLGLSYRLEIIADNGITYGMEKTHQDALHKIAEEHRQVMKQEMAAYLNQNDVEICPNLHPIEPN